MTDQLTPASIEEAFNQLRTQCVNLLMTRQAGIAEGSFIPFVSIENAPALQAIWEADEIPSFQADWMDVETIKFYNSDGSDQLIGMTRRGFLVDRPSLGGLEEVGSDDLSTDQLVRILTNIDRYTTISPLPGDLLDE